MCLQARWRCIKTYVGGKKVLFTSNIVGAILLIQLMLAKEINFTPNNTKMRYLFHNGFTYRMTT